MSHIYFSILESLISKNIAIYIIALLLILFIEIKHLCSISALFNSHIIYTILIITIITLNNDDYLGIIDTYSLIYGKINWLKIKKEEKRRKMKEVFEKDFYGRKLSIETGEIAKQAGEKRV